MNDQKYPLLERLHILRTSALSAIRDRAFDTLPLFYEDYSDGIVSGCSLITKHDTISISPGIIRHAGYMYYLRDTMTIPYHPTEKYMLLKIRFGMPEESENFIYRSVSIHLTEDLKVNTNEMELCRFKLKAGAVLRTQYVDFFDMATEFNTVNFISTPFASIGRDDNGSPKGTLHPVILATFANDALAYNLSGIDELFCLQALQYVPMSHNAIFFYIMRRLNAEIDAKDNWGLYNGLCQVLLSIKESGRRDIGRARKNRREVLVD